MAVKLVEILVDGKRITCQYDTKTGLYKAINVPPSSTDYGIIRAVDYAGNEANQEIELRQRGFMLDGIKIKSPNVFNVEYYTLTKSTRVANGDMVMDYVANKQKFNFTWNAIDSRQLDTIIEILWRSLPETKYCFHKLEYDDDLRHHEVTIYAGAIPHNLHRGDGKLWVWKDVKISLIER